MGTKSLSSALVTTSVKADLDPAYLGRLISKLTAVWDTANVKTSCIDAIQDGRRLRLITITFDVDTYEQLETTSSTKC